eukprot:CAMPEP_0173182492 /NCGR_PEP_ID=MMETSP1141-20130122/7870_1 /TAXON_ID=483371 /ORGANISM="non described non described, Strain CCMP2298" /LENGTH=128 /DNA_ID=CAMNT_0014105597 /DNA_START=689 /DNA_END=1075 /DNA_ORIENTATION=-
MVGSSTNDRWFDTVSSGTPASLSVTAFKKASWCSSFLMWQSPSRKRNVRATAAVTIITNWEEAWKSSGCGRSAASAKLYRDMYCVRWGPRASVPSSGMGLYHHPVNVHAPDASTVTVVSLTFNPIDCV